MPQQPTVEFRRAQLALRALTTRELLTLWKLLDPNDLDATFIPWAAAVTRLIAQRRQQSAALARAYITRLHPTTPTPAPTPPLPVAAVAVGLHVTGVYLVKRAMQTGTALQTAMNHAFTASTGSATRHVLDGGRDTIRTAVTRDPRAQGWTRVTAGGCDWCQSQADGSVLPGSVEMNAHDHCACTPEPVFA